jgi:ribosomal protein L37AE/L43A
MKYVGQGVWQCADCGWEQPQQEYRDHTHEVTT